MDNLDKSMSLVDAINDKYSIDEEDLQTNFIEFAKKDINKAKAYFSRIPECVSLQRYDIDCIGEEEELNKLCSNLKTLDIAGNKLTSWDHVLQLFKSIPCLQLLNISDNPLSGQFPDPGDVIASNVKTLILNQINTTWSEINYLQQCLPRLEELHFSLTDKSNIDPDTRHWPSVKCLHCSSSQLTTCDDLHTLGRMFPNVKSLTIVENSISAFGDSIESSFQELKSLNISKTAVCEWSELEKLRRLPKLCELRIKDIPLMEGLPEDQRRQHTIARLPMIKTLNGSSVSESEQESAERAFLRFYLSKDDKPLRFAELHEVHKDIKPLVDIDLSPVNFVTCMIIFEEKREMLKVNVKMTVNEFKNTLKEFVGLPLSKFCLIHNDPHLQYGSTPLSNGKKSLHTFVHDGDEFICQLNDMDIDSSPVATCMPPSDLSLVDAINDKYIIDDKDLRANLVRFVKNDIDKAKAYFSRIPQNVSLQRLDINSVGEEEELNKLCHNLKTLDIAGNKLTSWDHVLQLFKGIPYLQLLNISDNPLTGQFPDPGDVVASNVKYLILNQINISWSEINYLQQCLPSLEELHFSLTDKSNIDPDTRHWPSVKCLHCSSSQLTTCDDLHNLGRMFPNVKSLTIVENPISAFGESIEACFLELRSLNISKTAVCEWSELEKLRRLPKLCELRIKDIPLMEGLPEDHRRQHTIARLPMIKTLNGSSVSESQRESAERAFLRFYLSKDDKPSRFAELHEVHKDIKPLVDIDLSPVNVVTCMIIFEKKREMRKVNVKMTVSELKKTLKEFVGLPLNEFRLLHKDPILKHGSVVLTNGKKLLYSFVHDGDEFICQQSKTNRAPHPYLRRFKSKNLKSGES